MRTSMLRRGFITALAAVSAFGIVTAPSPATAAGPRPFFQLPFSCGQEWVGATRANHNPVEKVDFTKYGGGTNDAPVVASAAGTVTAAGWDPNSGTPGQVGSPSTPGRGYYVTIDHGSGWKTEHYHFIRQPLVSTGTVVSQGQQIGNVGSTGNSSGPHLHYEQRRDNVQVQTWFNGSQTTITPGSSQRLISYNCGDSQVFEADSSRAWGNLAVSGSSGMVTGTGLAALSFGNEKLVYTVRGGKVYEATSAYSWANNHTGISGVTGSGIAAIEIGGIKYVYTIINGGVYEASSANGWQNLPTGITGVSETALAAINFGGTKLVYTIKNGRIHEASSLSSWASGDTLVSGATVSAITANGVKFLYTLNGTQVVEAASNNGWTPQNVNGVSGPVTGTAVGALNYGGTRMVYTINNGALFEASGGASWQNLNTGAGSVAGSRIAVINFGGNKNIYTQ
jgi:hypothetical protein